MNSYWCDDCQGFVSVRKKYLRAILGNLLLLPLLTACKGPYIPTKKICKTCKGSVKRKNMSTVDVILPEITNNSKLVSVKKEKNTLLMYSIMSLIVVLIGFIAKFQEQGSILIL